MQEFDQEISLLGRLLSVVEVLSCVIIGQHSPERGSNMFKFRWTCPTQLFSCASSLQDLLLTGQVGKYSPHCARPASTNHLHSDEMPVQLWHILWTEMSERHPGHLCREPQDGLQTSLNIVRCNQPPASSGGYAGINHKQSWFQSTSCKVCIVYHHVYMASWCMALKAYGMCVLHQSPCTCLHAQCQLHQHLHLAVA